MFKVYSVDCFRYLVQVVQHAHCVVEEQRNYGGKCQPHSGMHTPQQCVSMPDRTANPTEAINVFIEQCGQHRVSAADSGLEPPALTETPQAFCLKACVPHDCNPTRVDCVALTVRHLLNPHLVSVSVAVVFTHPTYTPNLHIRRAHVSTWRWPPAAAHVGDVGHVPL